MWKAVECENHYGNACENCGGDGVLGYVNIEDGGEDGGFEMVVGVTENDLVGCYKGRRCRVVNQFKQYKMTYYSLICLDSGELFDSPSGFWRTA
jgi:hypothetical protein